MLRYDNIHGLPVFSIREGHRVGKVIRALLDRNEKRVMGFQVERESAGMFELPVEAVEAYGADALMIGSEDVLISVKQVETGESGGNSGQIIGIRVVTRAGTYVGDLASFFFDPGTGKVTHFEISGGMFRDMMHGRGLVPREGIVTLGEDICVADNTVKDITEVMKSEPGIRNRTLMLKNRMGTGTKELGSKTRHFMGSMGKAFSFQSVDERDQESKRKETPDDQTKGKDK